MHGAHRPTTGAPAALRLHSTLGAAQRVGLQLRGRKQPLLLRALLALLRARLVEDAVRLDEVEQVQVPDGGEGLARERGERRAQRGGGVRADAQQALRLAAVGWLGSGLGLGLGLA